MKIHIKNPRVLTHDEASYEIKSADIYIENGLISAIGEKPDGFDAQKTIEAAGALVIPGLINIHTHSYMSLLRNIADDLAFDDWLFGNILPREEKMNAEDAYWGNMLAFAEMLKSGTTCFLDMYIFAEQCAIAAKEVGIRAFMSRGLVGNGKNSVIDEGGQRRLNEALSEMKKFKGEELLSFMLAPHAIYTCDSEYIKEIMKAAREYGLGINIHLSETQKEYDDCVKEHGLSPAEYLERLGLFQLNTVAAHCVYMSAGDIEILKNNKVNVASCPVSNMKLANGFAPLREMSCAGVNVCLGTDGAASNNSLNMFREMNHAALIHKGTARDPLVLNAFEVFKMATVNGARALGIKSGRIAPGYNADLVLIDLNHPQLYPDNNLLAALVYSANGNEVKSVIIGGEPVLENGRLLNADEEKIYYMSNRILKGRF